MKICHLTSVHPRGDTRIFIKECRSLARAGHEVSLVVADGFGSIVRDGVNIVDAGVSDGRLARMLHGTRAVWRAGLKIDAEVYPLHDPELLPIGLWMKLKGKRVIFDAHEDVPRQVLDKPYLNRHVARVLSKMYELFEDWACSRLDAVVTATPTIRDRFARQQSKCIDVNNFPSLEEFPDSQPLGQREGSVVYVGAISETRGIRELVAALGKTRSSFTLELAGRFAPERLQSEVEAASAWSRVRFHGHLSRSAVHQLLLGSFAGLVTLHPTPSYVQALPVKMFEYMGAGIPVIASDFPLWRSIVEKHQCGVCVDPLDPSAIAAAIDRLAEDPEGAAQMGANGRTAVLTEYNWATEEAKLLKLYEQLHA